MIAILAGQAMSSGAFGASQAASAASLPRASSGAVQNGGFPPQYAQQLQNHLLLQQGGAFPFLPPGEPCLHPLCPKSRFGISSKVSAASCRVHIQICLCVTHPSLMCLTWHTWASLQSLVACKMV